MIGALGGAGHKVLPKSAGTGPDYAAQQPFMSRTRPQILHELGGAETMTILAE